MYSPGWSIVFVCEMVLLTVLTIAQYLQMVLFVTGLHCRSFLQNLATSRPDVSSVMLYEYVERLSEE